MATTAVANLARERSTSPATSRDSQRSVDASSNAEGMLDGALPERRRNSAFFEVGLGGNDAIVDAKLRKESRPKLQVRFKSEVDVFEHEVFDLPDTLPTNRDYEKMPIYFPTLPRLLFLAFAIVLIVPSLHTTPLIAEANPVRTSQHGVGVGLRREVTAGLVRRQNSPTDVCKRWSQQSAIVNGTLYLYGGRATSSSSQTSDTWNNDFLTLDLATSWQISAPPFTGLPRPDGPPPISLGYLWNSYDQLFVYGGQFSDNPVTLPVPFSTWTYSIASSAWSEHTDPQTVAGDNSDGGNQPVQRSSEGAGISIPYLGRGFYFGGHLDGYTTPGWSQSIPRVYIKGMLEYTFPGYGNAAVQSSGAAGPDGIYRNITSGGIQDTAGFTERADGLLVAVPGYGKSGIIIGLAGGTNETFTQMNVIDVYDIESSTWYKQATTGPTPDIRVNPCSVAVSAADGSSTQVYMYGGQNLIPFGEQIQYDDMWILTIPAFTWIQVDTTGQANPPARAGHTCNVWNSQMIVVGGYVGQDLSCDAPGVYVFNTSSLQWQTEYTSLQTDDPLNRQASQQNDPAALQGSYGYSVPEPVREVVGGNAVGAATITAPAQTASAGPLATGSPITYTVTQPDGSIATETSTPPAGDSGSNSGGGGLNVGAVVAGTIAGFFALLAAYLGFCAWLYRKQRNLYRAHVAMTAGFIGGGKYEKSRTTTDTRTSADNRSANSGNAGGGGVRSNYPYTRVGQGGAPTAASSSDELGDMEPSFLGVVLNPRRSLRVVNRD